MLTLISRDDVVEKNLQAIFRLHNVRSGNEYIEGIGYINEKDIERFGPGYLKSVLEAAKCGCEGCVACMINIARKYK